MLICTELDPREWVFEFRDFWELQAILADTKRSFPYIFRVKIKCGGRIVRTAWIPRFPGIGLASRMYNVEHVTIVITNFTFADINCYPCERKLA